MGKKEEKGVKKPTEPVDVVIIDASKIKDEVSPELLAESANVSGMVITAKAPERENETIKANASGDAIIALDAAEAKRDGRIESVDVNGKKKVASTKTTDEQYKEAAVTASEAQSNETQGDSSSER